MKTFTSSLLLGTLSSALHVLGFSDTAARVDPLGRIPSANYQGPGKSAAFCSWPCSLDRDAAHSIGHGC